MEVLIWIVATIFIPELVHGEALHARSWESVQNYLLVRPGAYIFYWLYYADGIRVGAENKPLIIYIQGAGVPASGVANYAEIGPLTMNMEPRNHTWVHGRNVLLLDDPVGTGFSTVTHESLLDKTDEHIANDLYAAIDEFLFIHKAFRETPTYLFGQGYGGKMCPILAYRLHTGIKEKRLQMNLKGIGIGSGFVDMRETILIYPNFLHSVGLIDQNTFLQTTTIAQKMHDSINNKSYATGLKWLSSVLIGNVNEQMNTTVNPYNINQPNPFPALELLKTIMNTYVKPSMSQVVDQKIEWNYVSDEVFQKLNETFLVPSVNFLEMVLNETDMKVVIYNGNLDAITPIAGASNWAHNLKWHGAEEFKEAPLHRIQGMGNGFYKVAKQLSFWRVFGAGHWVPEDNPVAMEQILKYLIPTYTII